MKKPSCLNPACSLHGKVESTRIIRYGFYRTRAGKRRRYRCAGCGQTFSTTKGTPYYRLQHRRTTFDTVVTLRVEGVSLSAIARVERLAWNTVARWLERAASVCRPFCHGRTTGFVAGTVNLTQTRPTRPQDEGLESRSEPACWGSASPILLNLTIPHTLRSLARRWMALAEEIALNDQHLARLTTATSPTLREGFGVGAHTAAELLIIFGDNPDRIRSEAAFAKLCGACPIPASSGMTTGRHRLNRGGHRHANAALYRAVIVRMRFHQPTRDYVARRIAAGRTKRDIIRCLKRFLAREIYQRVMTDFRARQEIIQAA